MEGDEIHNQAIGPLIKMHTSYFQSAKFYRNRNVPLAGVSWLVTFKDKGYSNTYVLEFLIFIKISIYVIYYVHELMTTKDTMSAINTKKAVV